MKLGILGGSFNPLHNGHIHIAREVQKKKQLDLVLFIPTHLPPHKAKDKLLPADFRLALLKKALKNFPGFQVSDMEIQRGGISYTIDTLKELHQRHPEAKLYFILGSDMVESLPSWKQIHHLFDLCQFLIVKRPHHPIHWEKLTSYFSPALIQKLQKGIVEVPPLDISSSQVRKALLEGKSIQGLVPESIRPLLEKNFLSFFKKNTPGN